ncbi:coniferyl-alcohol dehydrogenase [Photobacterium sagamiensis]|uniref:coniferyl-alcohol dehydrogenase n=1 Tax=Photobacterium sagamiensis TaxID=2910241 RepID=UPI003D12E505
MSFENKTIVVTGAASGIGQETAKMLKASGAKVIAMDRNEPTVENDLFIRVDLMRPESIEAAINSVPDGIDGLCNIAGVPPTIGAKVVLTVNVLALIKLTEGLIKKMNTKASIVNVTSLAGVGWPNSIPEIKSFLSSVNFENIDQYIEENSITDERSYFFGKEIISVWTMQNRWTWRDRNIRINAVSPGPVDTPVLGDFLATLGERADDDMALMGRAGSANDIAHAICFLANEESDWIRGTTIPCDGGMNSHVMSQINNF